MNETITSKLSVLDIKREIEEDFKDFHQVSQFLENDSMLLTQTDLIDTKINTEFILSDSIVKNNDYIEVRKKNLKKKKIYIFFLGKFFQKKTDQYHCC